MHFAVTAALTLFAGATACRATGRLVLEALAGVEFLLTSSKYELLIAVTAYDCFVLVHDGPPYIALSAIGLVRLRDRLG